jgi:hypothetical protein
MPLISGGGGGGGGGGTLIFDNTLAAPGSWNVTGIPQTFNDLLLRISARGTTADVSDTAHMTINSDAGANYGEQDVRGAGAAAGAVVGQGSNLTWACVFISGGAADAGMFSGGDLFLYEYASATKLKMGAGFAGAWNSVTGGGNSFASTQTVAWNSTAPITSIQVFGFHAANLATGSRLRVYGVT